LAILTNSYVEEVDNLLAVDWEVYEVIYRKKNGCKTYFRTRDNGSVLLKCGPRVSKVWVEQDVPYLENGVVYRLLNQTDESSFQEQGAILPKDYFAECTAEGHILHGCRSGFRGSRFLSASKQMEGIYAYAVGLLKKEGLNGEEAEYFEILLESMAIIVADVASLKERFISCIDAPLYMKGSTSRRFANATQEVLVDGEIPEACIVDINALDYRKII